jgi:hypothetical protein
MHPCYATYAISPHATRQTRSWRRIEAALGVHPFVFPFKARKATDVSFFSFFTFHAQKALFANLSLRSLVVIVAPEIVEFLL